MSAGADGARLAYDALAADYDEFTADLDYAPWLEEVLPRLRDRGLTGRHVLDVGCGTGKSLIPMLERGWSCCGCDISPRMIDVARSKVGDRARLTVADMRNLPQLGSFDLVWSLNDSINYLLDSRQLESALHSMRRNLAETGLLVFDVNTILTYRTYFAERRVSTCNSRSFIWDGRAVKDQPPSSVASACVEAAGDPSGGHLHRQRHFTESEILTALKRANLKCLEVFGQDEDAGLHQPLRELSQIKALYVARR